ncbi:MAG: isoleucine--tRNA ligase [Cytophagales bacterium]|nr:isoleucine--tRNA ligase [Cytophagales bacterium]
MNRYPEYKNTSYPDIAAKISKYWIEHNIYQKSEQIRAADTPFVFYEGPPSANGTPGIHHVMARTIKDIFCRYKTMQGYLVKRKGGWDTHGLPVELQVEKELGINKDDIGKTISVEEYNKKCRETVMRYKAQWDDLTQKMGYWVDLQNPYITFENDYIESCWHLLKTLYDKQLLYKGYTIQPYSPAAGTGLSSHELNQPGCYKLVKDTTVVAQFKVLRNDKSAMLYTNLGAENKAFTQRELLKSINSPEVTDTHSHTSWDEVYILAWTTTPWTLPSNSALAVGEKIIYTKVKTYNPYTYKPIAVILAKDLLLKYFHPKSAEIPLHSYNPGDKVIPYQVMEEYAGKDLLGIQYEQLMPYVKPVGKAFEVIAGDFVSTEDGTGVVHIAPTFGADDFRVARQAGIAPVLVADDTDKMVPLVDKKGKFVVQMGEFGGMYVKNYDDKDENDPNYKSVDVLISIKLKTENKAFKVEKYEHTYPHCWRTDKPVLYYPLESWFIKTTAVKDRMAQLNSTINWKPESTGTGRFGNWLENLVDWNLSRSRYWGTPLPIWRTEDGNEVKCIGSVQELKYEINQANITLSLNQNTTLDDLHRPYIDDIILVSPSGKPMRREPDLIDVWFDSGAMPYAQWHYPFDNKDIFKANFPADFISEGVDQTRGWFFTLHALSVMCFDAVAFKNVVSTGLVLDKNGEKMSKRKGNVVNPFDTLAKYGPDATRWYMVSNANPWDNLKFDIEGVAEVQRKFFNTLHNTYNFYALYANLDNYRADITVLGTAYFTEADRWIISKLHTLIKTVTSAYNDYEPTKAARALTDFVCDDLSNWYVRLNRKRYWLTLLNNDKKAAYQVLSYCIDKVVKLAAPIAPFYADEIYLNLHGTGSVHLADFPKYDNSLIDHNLETKMSLAQNITSLVHAIRKTHSLRVRLPLQKLILPTANATFIENVNAVAALIKNEVNVKEIVYMQDTSGIVKKKAKPNFQTLSKEYGRYLKDLGTAIATLTQDDIVAIENGNIYPVILTDITIPLSKDSLIITTEDIPGWAVASDGELTVALDTHITEELKKEGIARDFVNRVQNHRKELGFEVTDKIKIYIENKDALIDSALLSNKEYICTETQAIELKIESTISQPSIFDMDDFELKVKIEK